MSLLSIIPRPTPIELGEIPFLASELRLSDLSDLEAFIRAQNPDPYSVAGPFLAKLDPTSLAFKQLLADTIEKTALYSTDLTSEKANESLASIEGTIYFVWLVLKREHPNLTLDEVAKLLESTTVDQLERLSRVAWASDPLPKLYEYIVASPEEDKGGGSPRDWAGGWFRYLTECHNGPQFHELTLTQYSTFMLEGQIPDSTTVSGSPDQFDWERSNKIAAFFKELSNES